MPSEQLHAAREFARTFASLRDLLWTSFGSTKSYFRKTCKADLTLDIATAPLSLGDKFGDLPFVPGQVAIPGKHRTLKVSQTGLTWNRAPPISVALLEMLECLLRGRAPDKACWQLAAVVENHISAPRDPYDINGSETQGPHAKVCLQKLATLDGRYHPAPCSQATAFLLTSSEKFAWGLALTEWSRLIGSFNLQTGMLIETQMSTAIPTSS